MDMLPLDSDRKSAKYASEIAENLASPKSAKDGSSNIAEDTAIFNVEAVPKELDIFTCTEENFLPEGKDFDDLTPEELRLV